MTPSLLRKWPLPDPGHSKDRRGRVLVVGGARRLPGAALLAGTAALRVGAGVLTLSVAGSVAPYVAVAVPEAKVIGLPENDRGSLTGACVDELGDALDSTDAVLIGPGLDDAATSVAVLEALLPLIPRDVPVVLDAFALGVLPRLRDVAAPLRGRLVLTPNREEADRLLGHDVGDSADGPAEIATRFGAVVTCHSWICDADGRVWRSGSGHGGLGTSGSGDVLAGAVTGLLARGADPAQAACWSTHLHATAGDRLALEIGPLGFLARDLVSRLPGVMAELSVL